MNARSVRVGHVYRWGSGYWRVEGRRGGRVHVLKVRREVRGDGSVGFVPVGPPHSRELLRPGELRPL